MSYAGNKIRLDHILPRAIVPELAVRVINIDTLPTTVS
jgi:hypothetical protein